MERKTIRVKMTSILQKKMLFLQTVNPIIVGLFFLGLGPSSLVHAVPQQPQTVRIWLQTTDSCLTAVPGAVFILQDRGLRIKASPGSGTSPKKIGKVHGDCPIQHGNCLTIPVGCLSWLVPIPSSGTRIALITEKHPASGYAICLGGSDCPYGSNKITVKIDSTGHVSATDLNTYPNGTTRLFPTNRAPFAGTQTDPILVHNSRLGNGNCDGDNDADDHTTGAEGNSLRCDSDHDKQKSHLK